MCRFLFPVRSAIEACASNILTQADLEIVYASVDRHLGISVDGAKLHVKIGTTPSSRSQESRRYPETNGKDGGTRRYNYTFAGRAHSTVVELRAMYDPVIM